MCGYSLVGIQMEWLKGNVQVVAIMEHMMLVYILTA